MFRRDAEMRDKFGVSWKHAELPRMGRCIKEFVACSHAKIINFPYNTGFVVWRLDQTGWQCQAKIYIDIYIYSCDML